MTITATDTACDPLGDDNPRVVRAAPTIFFVVSGAVLLTRR
jgi:hypothetical protein